MNPNTLRTGFQTIFLDAFNQVKPVFERIATKTQSDGASESYGWLGNVPGMREMDGERMPKGLSSYDYSIKNKEFEGTVEVRKTDIDDNKITSKNAIVAALGARAAAFPDRLVFDLVNRGHQLACYDGQNFFDNDHEEGASGVQVNSFTGMDLTEDNYGLVKATLLGYKDDQGELANDNFELVLMVPTGALETKARKIMAAKNATGGDNLYAGDAEILVNPRLAAGVWFLLNVAGGLKPFIYQEREFIPMEYDGGSSDQQAAHELFMRKRLLFGPYLRANAGYGDWRKAVRVAV